MEVQRDEEGGGATEAEARTEVGAEAEETFPQIEDKWRKREMAGNHRPVISEGGLYQHMQCLEQNP